jgi:hypothetical protein
MSTHTVHPDVHEHGLADGCDRCGEHAQNPLTSLDEGTLRALLQRVVNRDGYRSENERVAILNMTRALQQAASLAELNPVLFAKYLKSRGVQLIAVTKP